MGSGFPTENYWPRFSDGTGNYIMEEYPGGALFQNFNNTPTFSGPTAPRFPIVSNSTLRQERLCRPELCYQFKRGKCNYGVNCIFSHISTDEKQEMIKNCSWDSNRGNASVPVSLVNSVVGDCEMGFDGMKRRRQWNSSYGGREIEENNAIPNPNWKKTKLCINWERSGTCAYDARCCFAHGKAELRQLNAVPAMEPTSAIAANTPAVSCKKIKTVSEKCKKDDKCYFKWKSIEKISQVYADWIDDISAVQFASIE